MKLYKRPNSPYWWYSFSVDGVIHRGSTKRPLSDEKSAKRVLADRYKELMDQSQFGDKPTITLAEAFDRVIDSVDNKNTKRSYQNTKNKVLGLGPFANGRKCVLQGSVLLHTINEGHLEDLVAEWKKAGNKPNTINVELRVFKRVVNINKKRFRTPEDLEFPMCEAFEKTRFLTYDEEHDILARLNMHEGFESYVKARDLFVFLIDTGVRIGEALNLKWSDVNMSDHVIETYRIKTRSLTLVPISDRVMEILKRRHNQSKPFEEMSRAIRIIRVVMDKVCNGNEKLNAQRGKATIHSLRDTYASRLAQKGMSLHKVSKLLGHTTTTMTRKYAHIEPKAAADEARRMING